MVAERAVHEHEGRSVAADIERDTHAGGRNESGHEELLVVDRARIVRDRASLDYSRFRHGTGVGAMNPPPRTRLVALLAVPDVSASTLYGLFDTLHSAGRHWPLLHGEANPMPAFRPVVASRDGRPLQLASGVTVTPDMSFAEADGAEIVCIPTLEVPPGPFLGTRYAEESTWLRARYAAGATLASACSGAVLLASTGLLDGLEATSHWAYCDALRREHPSTRWFPERSLVLAGEGRRIVTAGSGVSWHLLALHLIARFAGPEIAMQVARMKLMDINTASPVAYASLKVAPRAEDPPIARAQQWAAEHYRAATPVAQMVGLAGLSERTFTRRFQAATGMSPLAYVHALRLEEAKLMLETTDTPVEAIALEVGYQDPTFFGRLFRRRVAMTPALYRRRFGTLMRRVAAGDSK
jgi:transcriptional regulator GlxA family with amidase domain